MPQTVEAFYHDGIVEFKQGEVAVLAIEEGIVSADSISFSKNKFVNLADAIPGMQIAAGMNTSARPAPAAPM